MEAFVIALQIILASLCVFALFAFRWGIKFHQFRAVVGVDPPSCLGTVDPDQAAKAACEVLVQLEEYNSLHSSKQAKKLRGLMRYFKIDIRLE